MMMMVMTVMMMMMMMMMTTTTTAHAGSRSLEGSLCSCFWEKHVNRKRNNTTRATSATRAHANWGPGAEVPRLCSSSTDEANRTAGWAPGPRCNSTVQRTHQRFQCSAIYFVWLNLCYELFWCIVLKMSTWQQVSVYDVYSRRLFCLARYSPPEPQAAPMNYLPKPKNIDKLWSSGWSWRSLYAAGIKECMVSVYETMWSWICLKLFEVFIRTQSSKAYSLHDPRSQQTQPNSKQSPNEVQVTCDTWASASLHNKREESCLAPIWGCQSDFFSAHYLLCKHPSWPVVCALTIFWASRPCSCQRSSQRSTEVGWACSLQRSRRCQRILFECCGEL